ncbi:hypothetical protein [Vibrio phage vB_VpM-pA2SJ1]|uniref:Uncharacterized protein n=1 Tax=Vibrio phage vB_VpM-pA2SJ1 TaxID=3095964 RepID=A0AAX4J5V4_9CAUD
MEAMKATVGGQDYLIHDLPAETQFKMLHFIQKHDESGKFITLSVIGFKKTKENDDPDESFNSMARLILAGICKSVSATEYMDFCKTMLSRTFKDNGQDDAAVSIRDFQGNLKSYEILVAHSMRKQFGDFFQLNGQD